ncbi:MAG: peptidoglycan DD-metalloendopeptidase family protein [Aeromicrobium erythreum]
MRPSSCAAAALAVLAALVLVAPSPARADGSWTWPLGRTGSSAVDRAFDPPVDRYGPGHRGVDLAGSAGEVVRSVAPGRVVFVGRVAGVPVVTVDHGTERSTYQPVRATVRHGDAVGRGEPIGRLLGRPAHCARACLHLGRVRVGTDAAGARSRDYLDPLEVLEVAARFRLVDPTGPVPVPPAGSLGGSLGSLLRPVPGPVTSAFGMRVHPVTGVRKLHDGTDFGAPCGTPVRAAAAGTVRRVGTVGGYGRWVVLSHGRGLETRYAHLSRQSVRVGQRVSAGQVVGRVGSTGWSTGCHLHLMVVRSGRPVDPMG